MNNSSNLTSFFDQYKNAGISMELIAAVGLRAFLALIGILMNSSLLYVTIRTKSLRSICNILIALDTFAITIFLPINIFGFSIVLSGLNFIPSSICCFVIQPLPQICLNFSVICILFIAIDRFLSVFQPIWHANRNKRTYIFVIFCFCLFYALYMLQLCIRNVNPQHPTICSLASDCMQNGIASQFRVVLYGFTICFYVGIWIFMQFRAKNTQNTVKNQIVYTQRIFKPLAALISFYMIGYLINSIIRLFLVPSLNLSPIQNVFVSSYLSAFANLAMFCNGPILYLFSTEYRKAFNKIFGWKCEPIAVAVIPIKPFSKTKN